MKTYMIQLKCITNMHVGNGDVNYNIIDNEVERDSITNYPTINASGVKGALKEFFKRNQIDEKVIKDTFGGDAGASEQGKIKILGADMVALPARTSGGEKPFYLVSTEEAVTRVNELSNLFLGKDLFGKKEDSQKTVEVEGYMPVGKRKFGDKDIYIMKNEEFETLDLPVLARNKLDNGESQNLWYEEIVPHDSIFIFSVISEEAELMNKFKNDVEGKVIQFGGNASIGYGLCKVTVYE